MVETKVPDNDHPSIEKYIPEGYVPTENDINFVFNWNKYVTDRILETVSLAVIKDILDIFSVQIQDIENQEVILIPWDPNRCIVRRDIYGGDPGYSNSVLLTSENIQHEMKQPGVLSVELASVLKYAQNGYLNEYLDYQLLTEFAQNLLTIYVELKGMMKQPIQFHWDELESKKDSPVDLRKESIRIKNNENPEVCSKCGGKCCKNYAGAYHPNDFDELKTIEDFERILIDGKISIDWYEYEGTIDSQGYFLRPRHVGGDVIDPSYGERCIHLTDTGCELSFDERPYFCRKLEPRESTECGEADSKRGYAEAWSKYCDILSKLRLKYDKQTFTGEKPAMASLMEILFGTDQCTDEMMNDEDDK